MDALIHWLSSGEDSVVEMTAYWKSFLAKHQADLSSIAQINLSGTAPVIADRQGRKLSIDFLNNNQNYNKKKGSRKSELISRAMGAGRFGLNILDLSAGLGIDSVFLAQLGYTVTAIERNPLLFLALETAQKKLSADLQAHLSFHFASALEFLKTTPEKFDVIYFDPMFPEKKKSALPRQEMVMFRELVGTDDDATTVIETAMEVKKSKRVVVKRPLKAPVLFPNPQSQVEGKLIRFDIYGVQP